MLQLQIQELSLDQLAALVRDAEWRIGSNVAGGYPDENYINQQRSIIDAVDSEVQRRWKAKERI